MWSRCAGGGKSFFFFFFGNLPGSSFLEADFFWGEGTCFFLKLIQDFEFTFKWNSLVRTSFGGWFGRVESDEYLCCWNRGAPEEQKISLLVEDSQ